jgi:Protein of unknown function (DUF4007)
VLRGPLASPGFRGQFSGHETFPLRYGWLNKVFDALLHWKAKRSDSLFSRDQAIADFGVGKNMVSSMKHWALTSGMIEEFEDGYRPTWIGELLMMGKDGLDPYLESPAALWLIHWNIASNPNRATTWYWAFGCYSGLVFDQDRLLADLLQLCKDQDWKRVAPTTLKRDVECFIKTYAMGTRRSSPDVTEDSLESPLAELALIKPTGLRGSFQFQRGPKPSLPDGLFAFALDDFWRAQSTTANTLSVESITYEPGSPGRVFKLDEDAVIERLARIAQASDGVFEWTDTAGLSQVLRTGKKAHPKKLLRQSFLSTSPAQRAA